MANLGGLYIYICIYIYIYIVRPVVNGRPQEAPGAALGRLGRLGNRGQFPHIDLARDTARIPKASCLGKNRAESIHQLKYRHCGPSVQIYGCLLP